MTEGDYYQQPETYWDRVHVPFGHGPLDLLISLPMIIPLLMLGLASIFYAPLRPPGVLMPRWGRSIAKAVGPYLLYCSLALWHFGERLWLALVLGVLGAVATAMTIWQAKHRSR
jgi:hypothetical protein